MRRTPTRLVLLIATLVPAGLPAAAAEIAFSDQTTAAGLAHTSDSFFDTQAQGMFFGGAVGDFNRDGWPDLFLVGGGDRVDALYINNGDGTFTEQAAAWGVDALHRGRGATVGDYDGDGWPDIYVTSSGPTTIPARTDRHLLYHNNGNGTFTEVAAAAGVNEAATASTIATGSAFGDYDLDGDLDLFVATWDDGTGNRLFRNDGDGTFTDVTAAAGVEQAYWGFSPRFVDMNGDRYPELLVAADYYTSRYFINDGDGTFTDGTAASGTGLEDNGMGTTVADFDRDGRPDWYVTSIYAEQTIKDGNYLYVNQGNDVYVPLAESAGARDGGWGWGAEAVDFDHDGYVDIVETNGWISPGFEDDLSCLFRNNGDLTFSALQGGGTGFDHVAQGRTVLTLDYDRDGDMDVVLTAYEQPVALFRNDLSGTDTHWIQLALDTSAAPGLAPDGYGARVVATTGSVVQYVWVNGGASYLGRSQPVAHFGLGSASSVDITVEWPDGSVTELVDVAADQILSVGASSPGVPGESSPAADPATQLRASWNASTGEVQVDYTPACNASSHTVYYGALSDVASYDYAGAACGRGTSGSTVFDPAGLTDVFFVIVGTDESVEGSYGVDGFGQERPEDTLTAGCDRPRDLGATCAVP
jgi:hypothetical protein